MARICWRICAGLLVGLAGLPAALAQSPEHGEPDRGAAVAMACVVVGGLALVVALLRAIGRRNRPVVTQPAEGKPDLVAEAMAALDATELARGDTVPPDPSRRFASYVRGREG